MKIDIEKLTLGCSAFTNRVYAGVIDSEKMIWKHKVDVTNEFIDCAIKRWEGQKEIISCGSDKWEITIKKIK